MIKNFEIRAPDIKNIVGDISGIEKESAVIMSRAINRAATTAKATISNSKKGVPSVYNIASREVNPNVRIVKKSYKTNLLAIIEVKGRPRPLIKFSVSPKKLSRRKGSSGKPKEYAAAVLKGSGRKNLYGVPDKPFYAITKSGIDGIFSRKESKITKQIRIIKRLKRSKRIKVYEYKTKVRTGFPYKVHVLQMHFGPSVPQMVENASVMSKIQKEANEMLKKRINHEVSQYLERLKQ